jgi:hypothetical protein
MNAPRIAVLLPLAGAAVAVAVVLLWPRDSGTEAREIPMAPTRVETASARDGGDLSDQEATAQDKRKTVEPVAASATQRNMVGRSSANRPKAAARPIVLSGFVSDRAGIHISSLRADVRITDSHGNVRLAQIHEGFYSIDGCPDGVLELGCEAVGFRPVTRTITLDPVETEHVEDFVLDPGWLLAVQILTTDGHRIHDPEVKREEPIEGALRVEAHTARDEKGKGPFVPRDESEWFPGEFVPDTDGCLDVRVDPPIDVVARLGGSILATARVDARVDRVTLHVAPDAFASMTSGLVGRVVDSATLEPLPDVEVQLGIYSEEFPHGLQPAGSTHTVVKTDAAGKFGATQLRYGECTMSIMIPGHGWEMPTAELLPGKVTDVGTIALETPIVLRGRFVDTEGRPAVHAQGLLHVCGDSRALESIQSRTTIGVTGLEDGRFEFPCLAHKKYVMVVKPGGRITPEFPDWCAPSVLVDLTRGPIPDLVITVRASVEVLLNPATDAARDLGYWITSGDSIPECFGSFAGSGVVAERLAPGNYELVLGRGETVVRRIPFKLGEEPLTLDVAP